MNTKYMFKFKDDTNTAFEYEAASLDEAVIQAEHEVKLRGVEVAVYKLMFSSLPPETIDHAEKHLDEIIEEPSRTLEQSFVDYIRKSHVEQKCPIPYAKIQHRADFLDNFKDGWALFNSNALFRTIAMLVMNGASEYDLMLELIFMIDGHTAPDTSHLKPFHKQKPTDNETK